uniref:Sucrose phosphatase-like domain-containing protein n=1 Tax=Brassica oleracea TaxID=3712 RepID=A0A3P6F9Z3_BRAOL|nr:unnamed protein product [Brassica oleracea]
MGLLSDISKKNEACAKVDHHNDLENFSLLRFNSLWEDVFRHNCLLVFSTRRTLALYKKLRKQRPLLTP